MSNRPAQPQSDLGDRGQQYLQSAVQTASPARLRLMLIERAIGLSESLADSWRTKTARGANEQSIRLLDILTELLQGVVGGETQKENEVCHKVADLYVFLSQHLVAAESASDADAIDEIRLILGIEAETWRAVCAQELSRTTAGLPDAAAATSGSLNLEA